jgi:hypothetical protein
MNFVHVYGRHGGLTRIQRTRDPPATQISDSNLESGRPARYSIVSEPLSSNPQWVDAVAHPHRTSALTSIRDLQKNLPVELLQSLHLRLTHLHHWEIPEFLSPETLLFGVVLLGSFSPSQAVTVASPFLPLCFTIYSHDSGTRPLLYKNLASPAPLVCKIRLPISNPIQPVRLAIELWKKCEIVVARIDGDASSGCTSWRCLR